MRIGIIVEGESEYYSLPLILKSLGGAYEHAWLKVVKAVIPPKASYGVMANACKSRLRLLETEGVDRILVLIDREDRDECSGTIASGLAASLIKLTQTEVFVVVKDRTYENWLIADLEAIKNQRKRYSISAAAERSVIPDKADKVDALRYLKKICSGRYDKVEDSKKIARFATPIRIAANSRSFRRFLRCMGHQRYRRQSATP